MKTQAPLLAALLSLSLGWAGDDITPHLRDGAGYESPELHYRVVGVSEEGTHIDVWVVAGPPVVTRQSEVSRIIRDIRRRFCTPQGSPTFTAIWFFSAVDRDPTYPTFHIGQHVATYNLKENKTHFGPGAEEHYGGWANGPRN